MIQSWMMPIAEVLINGQKRKLYGKKKNKLYLNDGEEFQIRLKNPSPYRVGISIKINGEYEGKLLILPAYKDFVLDRFINDKKKYVFKTYEILGSADDVKKAVKKNGTVEIEFFQEKDIDWNPPITTTWTYTSTSTWSGCTLRSSGLSGSNGTAGSGSALSYPNLDMTKDYWFPSSDGSVKTFTVSTDGVDKEKAMKKWSPVLDALNVTDNDKRAWMANYAENHQKNESATYATLGNIQGMGSVTATPGSVWASGSGAMGSGDIVYNTLPSIMRDMANGTWYDGKDYTPEITQLSAPLVKAETGRIEKGDKSNQKFEKTEFKKGDSITKFKFKLLPTSVKEAKKKLQPSPTPTKQFGEDLHVEGIIKKIDNVYYFPNSNEMRVYCSNPKCGYRIRNRQWNVCPICGTKIK